MKYWRLSVGTLFLAVALPLCCGYYVVDGPQADDAIMGSPCFDRKGCETIAYSICSADNGKGICICMIGMIPNGDGKSCVSGEEAVGSTCFNNVGCELLPNSECSVFTGKGMCICYDGYIPNDDGESCVAGIKTLGSTCYNNVGCDPVANTKCNVDTGKGKCICNDGMIPNIGGKSCVAVIGSTCNDTATCEAYLANTECNGGKCQCKSGYLQKSSICKPGAGSNCNDTGTCGDQYATCAEGICKCSDGYTAVEGICRPGLHAKCDATDNLCNDSVAVCSQKNLCECQDSYTEFENKCLAPYNMTCTPDDGCITENADCMNITQVEWKCLCPNEGKYIVDVDLCSVIGSTCNNDTTCEHQLSNTECNGDKCQCKFGYLEKSGICEPGAGSNCSETDICGDKYATCTDGKCQCKANYTAMEGVCRPGLHEKCDDTDNKCIDSVAVCKNSTCECQENYLEKDDKCLAPYNMTCSPDDGCITENAVCKDNTQTMEWKCLCPNEGKYIMHGDKCSDSKLGDACPNGNECTGMTECYKGFCTCKKGSSAGDDLVCKSGDATIGSTCFNNVGCEQVTGLKCSASAGIGKCTCSDGFHDQGDGKTCVQGIGSSCTPSSGCLDPAMECKETPDGVYTCQCREGYEAAGDVCRKTGHSVHVHVDVDVDVDV